MDCSGACGAGCSAAGLRRSFGNLFECQAHGTHLCDRNCRSRVYSAALGATICSVSGRTFELAATSLARKRSATDFSPLALAEVNRAAVRAAKAASHDVRPGEAAFLRDETLALLNTPVGGDIRAPQQWNDDME